MGNNAFGRLFTITTWGESHGKAIGVVIDGCPAGLEISEQEISEALSLRAPGKTSWTSPRAEPDEAEILSGVFEGRTTGTPISIVIWNRDADSTQYEAVKEVLRPGHANYTYLQKYGVFDYRGGGRASARETACRVAAGAVARKWIGTLGIEVLAFLKRVGSAEAVADGAEARLVREQVYRSPVYCPDPQASGRIVQEIEAARSLGDSIGGVVEFWIRGAPPGLGDPVYRKLEAQLALAMLSIPASKGFEVGSGFACAGATGSEHNDLFVRNEQGIRTQSNHAGGILGGISNGMPIIGRVAFKPASSIMREQETLTCGGDPAKLVLPPGSRHDPCVAIRAVPVVEAMACLVIADAILLNRSAKVL